MDAKCLQTAVANSLEVLTLKQEREKSITREEQKGPCSCHKVIIGKHTFRKWAEPLDLVEIREFSPDVLEALGEDDLLFVDGQKETAGNLYLREAQDFKPHTIEKLRSCAEVKLVSGYRIKGFPKKAEHLLKTPSGPHRCNYCLYRSRNALLIKTAREARRAIAAIKCAQKNHTQLIKTHTVKAGEILSTTRTADDLAEDR